MVRAASSGGHGIEPSLRSNGIRDAAFLNAWVYGTTTPPMPGHPDWTVDPAATTAARTLAAPAALTFRHRR
jgi:hypothetical protein